MSPSFALVHGAWSRAADAPGELVLDRVTCFSLAPWKPVIEQRLGQQLDATVRGDRVSWEIGRQRGMCTD
jgi:hypothetical protein